MMTQPKGGRCRAAALALCGLAVIATAACSPAASASPAGSPQSAASIPVLFNCGGQAQVRPGQYDVSCTVGASLAGLHWATWGSSAALASGSYAFDDCVPNCVGGHGHTVAALAVLWDVQALPGHADERYFTRLTIIYEGSRSYRAGGKLYQLPQTGTIPLSQHGSLPGI
jgi:hypothetical protein